MKKSGFDELVEPLKCEARTVWSFKQQRRLIEIGRLTNDLEEAARLMGMPVASIKKLSMRLGISFKSGLPSKPRIKKR